MEKNSTNQDILSGKGLPPIPANPQTVVKPGITTEHRGGNTSGIRLDQFSQKTEKNRGEE